MADTIQHDGVEHAGYLSYVSLLAICPFLILFTWLAGMIGTMDIGQQLINLLLDNLPRDVAKALAPRFGELAQGPPQGLLPVALISAVWTSSSAVEGMRTVLNRAYRVTTPPSYWFRRSLSIVQFLLFMALLTGGMMILIFAPIVIEFLQNKLHTDLGITAFVRFTGFGLIAFILFAVVCFLYYLLPNIRQRMRHVIPGALAATALWVLAASLFSFYLSRFDQINIVYGSLEGIIVTLIFFYTMSLIFIYGAEFNFRLDEAFGYKLEEKIHAGES